MLHDRVFQRPPYLESETPSSPACSLCCSRQRSGSRPLAVDRFAAEVFPASGCAQRSVPGQVRGRPQNAACRAQTRLPRNPHGTAESQGFRGLAPSVVPTPHGWFIPNVRSAERNTRYVIWASAPIAWRSQTIDSSLWPDSMVTFRWRDSAHHNKKRLMTLPVNEFLRRFLLHVLPPGFVRIRYFGLMAHRRRGAALPLCLQLLAQSGRFLKAEPAGKGACAPRPLWTCPQLRRAHGPDQTTQLHGAPIAISTHYRRPTAMTRSLTSPIPNVSRHYRHTCVRVPRREALKCRKYTSRQRVETSIGNTLSRAPAFSTLPGFQNT